MLTFVGLKKFIWEITVWQERQQLAEHGQFHEALIVVTGFLRHHFRGGRIRLR